MNLRNAPEKRAQKARLHDLREIAILREKAARFLDSLLLKRAVLSTRADVRAADDAALLARVDFQLAQRRSCIAAANLAALRIARASPPTSRVKNNARDV